MGKRDEATKKMAGGVSNRWGQWLPVGKEMSRRGREAKETEGGGGGWGREELVGGGWRVRFGGQGRLQW